VNGLNFVLRPWTPFFDPFKHSITQVDQWIRIPRLSWEFWDQGSFLSLLSTVGQVVRIDHNTLFRLKGKFARVCVQIDVTQPLPSSLTVSMGDHSMHVSLIYEGLHEVCPLCGNDSHLLDSCPKLPLNKKIEVIVEKFDAQGFGDIRLLLHLLLLILSLLRTMLQLLLKSVSKPPSLPGVPMPVPFVRTPLPLSPKESLFWIPLPTIVLLNRGVLPLPNLPP